MSSHTSLSVLLERMELNTIESEQSAVVPLEQTLQKIALQIGALERKNRDLANINRRLSTSLKEFHKKGRP
ncbi:hypothetical protein DPV78_003443 [Talaromyces pinophilus]|nr:hypothetical protein DPV78_003443 [Talaromyces pinophilus]